MLKAVLAATTALTIAGTTLALAQQGDRQRDQRRWQPTAEDIRAFQAARIAALRAGLVLTPEQEKHWPAFEAAVRELQQLRADRIKDHIEARRDRRDGDRQGADPAERLRRHATRMTEAGAVLKKLADATDPLYRSLDDGQRRRFAVLSRMMGPRGGPGGRQWRERDGGDHRMQRQRHTEAVPGTMAGAIAAEIATGRKPVDAAAADLNFARKPVDTTPVEPGLAREPLSTSYKADGFNRKPAGFNQKPSAESL